jgi:hypothetical protein
VSSRYLDLIRQATGPETRTEERPSHPCVTCHAETDSEDLFCPVCWARRRERGRLLAFDPARRGRALARHTRALCSVHGTATVWTVNARGDAWCALCFPPGGAA